VSLISKFDPWCSTLCTCPPKLTLNPYTGCDHTCVYCYAASYIPNFSRCRPKKDLLTRLRKEALKLKGETISMSNSSDPYPNLEAKTGLTRSCLDILSKQNCNLQIVTKSSLITRDTDLLKNVPSTVSMTITTPDNETAKLIEPNAPSPAQRLEAIQTLTSEGIPTTVRIDPIVPFVNEDQTELVKTLATIGIKHITASTLKINAHIWRKLAATLPKTAEKLAPLYFKQGEKAGRYTYLPRTLRFRLLKNVADLAKNHGMKFGVCRESLAQLNTATCDGSWLLSELAAKRI
jgi:DNA repair photolyase